MNGDYRVPETVEMVIDGVLDLHTFSPKDLKHLIPDYLDACLQKNITEVRIIHGKGRGVLRRTVHTLLDRLSCVASYRLATHDQGNWGATVVTLKQPGSGSQTARWEKTEKR